MVFTCNQVPWLICFSLLPSLPAASLTYSIYCSPSWWSNSFHLNPMLDLSMRTAQETRNHYYPMPKEIHSTGLEMYSSVVENLCRIRRPLVGGLAAQKLSKCKNSTAFEGSFIRKVKCGDNWTLKAEFYIWKVLSVEKQVRFHHRWPRRKIKNVSFLKHSLKKRK